MSTPDPIIPNTSNFQREYFAVLCLQVIILGEITISLDDEEHLPQKLYIIGASVLAWGWGCFITLDTNTIFIMPWGLEPKT